MKDLKSTEVRSKEKIGFFFHSFRSLRMLYRQLQSKSSYRSRAGRHFYGTEIEIWASLGPVGNTENKLGADYEQLLTLLFSCFQGPRGKKN